jgi:hypothetical protein
MGPLVMGPLVMGPYVGVPMIQLRLLCKEDQREALDMSSLYFLFF